MSVISRFRKRKQYIFLLDSLAQAIAFWLFWPELGRFFFAFVDNTAAEFALNKGYSRDPDCNIIVSLFWTTVGLLGACPWLERVPSSAQVADAVSRNDLAAAHARGWKHFNADLTHIWDLISAAVERHTVASQFTARKILREVARLRSAHGLPAASFEGEIKSRSSMTKH